LVSIFLIAGLVSAPAFAEEKVEKTQIEIMRQSIINLIRQLASKGVLSKDDADKMLKDANGAAFNATAVQSAVAASAVAPQSGVAAMNLEPQSGVAAASAVPAADTVAPGTVRVPYIPESIKLEMTEIIKHEVLAQARGERWGDPGSIPDWLSRISFDGDFRLRYQKDAFPEGNALPTGQYSPGITNTTDDHKYMRVQARLTMKAKLSDVTYTEFRISSGTTTNPVSTNQTLGTGFNKSSLVLDRAYVRSEPYSWLTFNGGKIPNPWLSTDLVWDSDVNFEGVATQLKPRLSDTWAGFLTVGAFPYQDIQRSDVVYANSKWLYGTQLGFVWAIPDSSNAQFGVALYNYINAEGAINPAVGSHMYDQSAAQGMQKGNSLMYVNANGDSTIYGVASKFKELNITAKWDWASFSPFHAIFTADYVRNLGYNLEEIMSRTGLSQSQLPPLGINGHQFMLTLGVPRIRRSGEWQANVAYKYLESDAVLDALTDSDFHLGGTNAKGYVVGGSYGVDNNTWLSLRWSNTDQIWGPTLAIDTLQVDLNTRF
jgi:hypothetical protein